MQIQALSPHALLISFGDTITKECAQRVQSAYRQISERNDQHLWEVIPSYTTIFISYDYFYYTFEFLKESLLSWIDAQKEIKQCVETVVIDVYYGEEVGLDLARIAEAKGLSLEEVVAIHSGAVYDVYAMGFLPGFGFLGEVDTRIATPRLAAPRKKVPAGSVAIADRQTAVYPRASAGGWNIIGKTTHNLFDSGLDSLSPLSFGKRVRFNPITKEEFLAQGGVL